MACEGKLRRTFLKTGLSVLSSASVSQGEDTDANAAIEYAHRELWRRFVDPKHSILYDYAGLDGKVVLPVAEECAQSKPNALSWWTPIENGAFFGGLYLDALCNRWKWKKDPQTAARARRIAWGLRKLASVGKAAGFVARGICGDGVGHYVAGSDDQTFPWFYGLWRYLRSGIPDSNERQNTLAMMISVAEALKTYNWRMPCDRDGFGFRGSWAEPNFIHAARVLFVARAVHDLTGTHIWKEEYVQLSKERPGGSTLTRLELCAQGAKYGPVGSKAGYPENPEFWTSASSQAALRGLWEMETASEIRNAYRTGIETNAEAARPHINRYRDFDPEDRSAFNIDWRFLNDIWTPQTSIAEAVRLATSQVREWHRRSPRRVYESKHMREPLFAAWVASFSPDAKLLTDVTAEVTRALKYYNWTTLYTSLFFAAEGAYYQIISSQRNLKQSH